MSSLSEEVVAAHNAYRSAVGVRPLVWSDALAQGAQQWANHLTADVHGLEHSDAGGENLWAGTTGASPTEMVGAWGAEQQFFMNGGTFPDVSTSGNWEDVGHYTQVIWSQTTEVGGATATDGDMTYFVCRYSPPGNMEGSSVF